MTDDANSLRQQYDAIAARLEDAGAPDARDAIKGEIISLFKQTEQEIARDDRAAR